MSLSFDGDLWVRPISNTTVPLVNRRLLSIVLFLVAFALAVGFVTQLVASNPSRASTGIVELMVAASISLILVLLTPGLYSLRRLELPGVFLATYGLFIVIPGFFVYLDKPDPSASTFYLAVLSVLILFPLGVLAMSTMALTTSNWKSSRAESALPILVPSDQTMKSVWYVFLFLSLVVVVFYAIWVRTIPIVEIFVQPGQTETLKVLRDESFKLLPIPLAYGFSWARWFLIPYCGLLALVMAHTTGATVWRMRAWIGFLIAIIFASAASAKAPIIYVIVMFAGMNYLLSPGKKGIRRLVVVSASAAAISLIILIQVSGQTPADAFSELLQRVFYVPAEVAYEYFAAFPNYVGFQHGQSLFIPSAFLSLFTDVHFFDVPNFIFRRMFPWAIPTGTANATFAASFWADFGWPGVLGGSLITGGVVRALQLYVHSHRDVWTVAYGGFLLIPVGLELLSESLQVTLVTDGVLVGLATTIVLRHLAVLHTASARPAPGAGGRMPR